MEKRVLQWTAVGLLACATAFGADLAVWNSNNSTPLADSFDAGTKADGLAVSPLVRGPGLVYSGSPAKNTFAAHHYDQTSYETAFSGGDYWETTLDPQGGFLSLENLSYSFGGPKSGPLSWQWAYRVGSSGTWTPLGTPYVSTRTSTKYEASSVDLTGIPLSDQPVSFRLVAWGGGTANTAWGNFGQDTNVLAFTGSLESGGGAPVVRFTPAMANVDVGETLEIEVAALPSGSTISSWNCSPTPAGTPTLSNGVFRYTAQAADVTKRFTLTVTANNSKGSTTASTSFFVNKAADPGTLTLSFDNERQPSWSATVDVEIPAGSGQMWTLQKCMIDPAGTDDRVYSGRGRALRFAYDAESSFASKTPVLQFPENAKLQTNGIRRISFWYGVFPADAAEGSEHAIRPALVTELSDDAKTWVEVDRVSTMGTETDLLERVVDVDVASPVYMRLRVEGLSGSSRVNVDQLRITPTVTDLDGYLKFLRDHNVTPGDALTEKTDDYDGDGSNNQREYMRKTDPYDPNSK